MISNKGQANFVILIVVALVLGTIGLTIVDSLIEPMSNLSTQAQQNVTLVNGTAVTLSQTDIISTPTFTAPNTTVIDTSNYTLDKTAGTITLIDADYDGNETIVSSFTYEADEYVDSSIARTILDNIPVLFGVGLLIISIIYFWD